MSMSRLTKYLLWCTPLFLPTYSQALDNLKFEGDLVHEPCVIAPDDSTISLDFASIVDKYLYAHTRTEAQTVTIHLSNCDLDLAKSVQISFTGQESGGLPGHLAVSIGGQPGGIALGLESIDDGALIPVNGKSERQEITAGDSWIKFAAFIRGEPQAIKNKTIARGPFSTILNFSLYYE